MKIKGKIKLKMTAEGFRVMALKLALLMDNMALIWLYGIMVFSRVKLMNLTQIPLQLKLENDSDFLDQKWISPILKVLLFFISK